MLSATGLVGACSSTLVQAAPPTSAFGVWAREGEGAVKDQAFVRGDSAGGRWADIEKSPGVYDWSAIDAAVERVQKGDNFLFLSFEVGPDAPRWIYEKGVPKVVTAGDELHKDKFPFYPYYPSPEYKMYFQRFITEAAKHIRSYPLEKQKRIVFIQVKTGCTGDEVPYKGEPEVPALRLPTEYRVVSNGKGAKYANKAGGDKTDKKTMKSKE